jgi:uncharacterized protein YbjT (DUF2867 family)
MYAITGVTGHVGGATAQELLAKGEQVRAVVRDAAKGEPWSQRGAEVGVADVGDPAGLANAFRGCRGAFVLLPANPLASDFDADQLRLVEAITAAVVDSGVPHVVLLSAIGADLAQGNGPIRGLYNLENRLRETRVRLSAIRSFQFQEDVEQVLEPATQAGIYPVLGEANVPAPRIATRDIGALAAETLLNPPAANEVVDLAGPEYTHRHIANALSAALGKPLQVVTIPRPGWVDAMVDGGVPRPFAIELAEMNDAIQRGVLQPRGDRQHKCLTEIEETLRHIVQATA